jgi:hypothetical protein
VNIHSLLKSSVQLQGGFFQVQESHHLGHKSEHRHRHTPSSLLKIHPVVIDTCSAS